MQENLPLLRDIHIPEGVSAFPPAYGWWVILACVLGLILLYQIIKFIRSKSKKLFALRLLNRIDLSNPIIAAQKISEILRRICVYKYPEALTLFNQDWINFLNSHTKTKLSKKASDLLNNAPYISTSSKSFTYNHAEELKAFATRWIGENL